MFLAATRARLDLAGLASAQPVAGRQRSLQEARTTHRNQRFHTSRRAPILGESSGGNSTPPGKTAPLRSETEQEESEKSTGRGGQRLRSTAVLLPWTNQCFPSPSPPHPYSFFSEFTPKSTNNLLDCTRSVPEEAVMTPLRLHFPSLLHKSSRIPVDTILINFSSFSVVSTLCISSSQSHTDWSPHPVLSGSTATGDCPRDHPHKPCLLFDC